MGARIGGHVTRRILWLWDVSSLSEVRPDSGKTRPMMLGKRVAATRGRSPDL